MEIETFLKKEFARLEEIKSGYSAECTKFSKHARTNEEYHRYYSGKLMELCMFTMSEQNVIMERIKGIMRKTESGFNQNEFEKLREKLGWFVVKIQNDFKSDNKNKF